MGIWTKSIPVVRKFMIVVIKFIAPIKEDTPAKWSLKIPESTEGPHELNYLLKVGRLFNLFLFQAPTLFSRLDKLMYIIRIKTLNYLSEDTLYLVLQLLKGLFSYQKPQSK